jgi:hypothetical protein
MSSRALASQRNKRTNDTKNNIPASNKVPTPVNKPKELSVSQAFSFINERLTVLENKMNEIYNPNNNIQMISNVSKQDETYYSEQADNIVKDVVTTIDNKFIDIKHELFEYVDNSIKNINIEDNSNKKVDQLKDMIINLQNFTLEINNTMLQQINSRELMSEEMNIESYEDVDISFNNINYETCQEEGNTKSDLLGIMNQLNSISNNSMNIMNVEEDKTEDLINVVVEQNIMNETDTEDEIVNMPIIETTDAQISIIDEPIIEENIIENIIEENQSNV